MICTKMQLVHKADQRELQYLGMKIFFKDNEHIKNSVVVVSVRSGNCVRCKQNYEYNQNDICDTYK
jgi:hypothetical protein